MKKVKENVLTVLGITFLIAFSIPAFSSNLSRSSVRMLDIAQWVTWIAFALDIIYEFIVSSSKRQYFKSHLLDFVAVLLPFFRPLRLLRLISFGSFVLQKIAVGKSFAVTLKVGITAFFVCYLAAVQVTILERDVENSNIHTFNDGIWWALTTVTTVGYGDRFPVTTEGRVIAFFLMLTGVALVGVITASVAAWFVKLNQDEID